MALTGLFCSVVSLQTVPLSSLSRLKTKVRMDQDPRTAANSPKTNPDELQTGIKLGVLEGCFRKRKKI